MVCMSPPLAQGRSRRGNRRGSKNCLHAIMKRGEPVCAGRPRPGNLTFILRPVDPHEYGPSCEGRPSHPQRTESQMRGKTAKEAASMRPPPFAGFAKPSRKLAFFSGAKKPGERPGLGILVEWRRIELPTFALRTRRSPS